MADNACYDEPYIPASFKGAPVDAMEVTSEGGRRGAEGEFPFGETTAYADLGRRIRTYSLHGRFAGNDHNEAASLFIAACESPGPGPLVHPTRGIVIVACKSVKVSDDLYEDRGVTYVDCEFVEANDWVSGFAFGSVLLNAVSTVALIAAAFDSFDDRYKPEDARFFRVTEITGRTRDAMITIRNQFVKATANVNTDRAVARATIDFDTAILTPFTFTNTADTHVLLNSGMRAVAKYTEADTKYDAMLAIANWAAQSVNEIDVAGESIDSLLATVRIVAAAYMTDGALATTPETINDGLVQRDQILAILGQEIDAARARCDNNLFMALRTFFTEVDTALLRRALELPTFVEYNFRATTHSLVAAYEIYDDAKRFGEIQRRNPSSPPWAIRPRVVAAVQP